MMYNRKLSAIFHSDSPFIESHSLLNPCVSVESQEKISVAISRDKLFHSSGDEIFSLINKKAEDLLKKLAITGILLLHEKLKNGELQPNNKLTPTLVEDSAWPKDANIFDRVISKMFGILGVESGYWEKVIQYNSEITNLREGRYLILSHGIIWPESRSTALMLYRPYDNVVLSKDPRLENRAFVVPIVQYSNILQEAPDFTFFSNGVNALSFSRHSQLPVIEQKPEAPGKRTFSCNQSLSIHAPVLGVITLED